MKLINSSNILISLKVNQSYQILCTIPIESFLCVCSDKEEKTKT